MKGSAEFMEVCRRVWEARPHECGAPHADADALPFESYKGCGRWLIEAAPHNFHHVVKRSHGGFHEERNMALLCFECHAGRHGRRVKGAAWLG